MIKKTIINLSLLILLLYVHLAAASPAGEPDAAKESHLQKKFTFLPRPHATGTPTRVEVGVYFLDINKIDDVSQTFSADFFLFISWHDQRLAAKNPEEQRITREFQPDEIWRPQLEIVNQYDLKKHRKDIYIVDPAGVVRYMQRFTGELSSPLHLEDFPTDIQSLEINITSIGHGPEDVELVTDKLRTGQRGSFSLPGWETEVKPAKVTGEYLASQKRSLARIDFKISARRHTGFYLVKIIFPLVLIVLMAWTVFWIDPSLAGTQIGISTASVFSLLLYQSRLTQLLPRISYLTRLDIFVLGATLLVFLALGETILTSRLAKSGKEVLGRRIDTRARWIYLVLFFLIMVYCFFIL